MEFLFLEGVELCCRLGGETGPAADTEPAAPGVYLLPYYLYPIIKPLCYQGVSPILGIDQSINQFYCRSETLW